MIERRADVKEMSKDIKLILDILRGEGNGEDGLITQSALTKQSLARLWKFVWSAVLVTSGFILGIVGWIVKSLG